MDLTETHATQSLTETGLEQAFEVAKRYAQKSRAASTWRAYHNDWRQFEAWCASLVLETLPATPNTVAMFVANQADIGRSPSTINRRLAAIRLVHLGAGHGSPHNALQVTEVMRGIRRDWGRPPAQKAAAIDEEIKQMADAVEHDEVTADVNLPESTSDRWRRILEERALEDDELEPYDSDFRDTPVRIARAIRSEIQAGQSSISSLVPHSRRYFERLAEHVNLLWTVNLQITSICCSHSPLR